MSLFAFFGAVELGLIYAPLAIAVLLSFRILHFPDLTVDGSFPLGSAVAAASIVGGLDYITATILACCAGAIAGFITAYLNQRFGILHLLASILTMVASFSVILRIMGRPNLPLLNQVTLLTPFATLGDNLGISPLYSKSLAALFIVIIVASLVVALLYTEWGVVMRGVGENPKMARANGIRTKNVIYAGMALSNALAALSGALFAQWVGFADATLGAGTIIYGLAAVIIGESLLRPRGMWLAVIACMGGMILYRVAIAVALNVDAIGLKPSDLNLVTATIVVLALILPKTTWHRQIKTMLSRGRDA
ncbi:MAG: ABC transporter permease [Alphaproteobacteria bacterium]|nr:ABC transporter permease [Alphaproteobacteria bacterium]